MYDRFERKIDYLRISVTDRCNLRCVYCMPEGGVPLVPREDVLSFEEIAEVADIAVTMGVTKLRLTGGDPLVRKGVVRLTAMLARITGVNDLAMSTNGVLLERFAQPLADAGLHRVNISLDAVDPQRYAEVTRGGDVARVRRGIEAAQAAGLTPVKLNCVVERSGDEPDARQVAEFAARQGLAVRFIRRMNFTTGSFWPVEGGSGGVCSSCNRLRLTSDGHVKPCLFSDASFSVRDLGAREAIEEALAAKPEAGGASPGTRINRVGG